MFSTPAKRRKVSPSESIPVDASNTEGAPEGQSIQTTPKPPSYLSPTKASLARFNPDILRRSASHSPEKDNIGPVDNGSAIDDLDEIRRHRIALFEEKAAATNAIPDSQRGENGEVLEVERVGLSQPLRRKSHSQEMLWSDHGSENNAQSSFPFRTSQIPDDSERILSLEGQARVEQDRFQAARLLSRLIPLDEGEPELPPTPVELGLEMKAPPPSGILSSSPSSRSSQRKKRKVSEGVRSSPLKPKDRRPDLDSEMEGVPLLSLRPKVPEFSEEVLRKLRLKDELTAQLDKLKEEVEMLEAEIRGDRYEGTQPLAMTEQDLLYAKSLDYLCIN
jgi:hypothetical protein